LKQYLFVGWCKHFYLGWQFLVKSAKHVAYYFFVQIHFRQQTENEQPKSSRKLLATSLLEHFLLCCKNK